MAIKDMTGQHGTITEGWRALELFTDRYEAIRLFSFYLNNDPPQEKILFFYGSGGNGKSLLLRYLQNCCLKRFSHDNWQWLKAQSDEELVLNIEKAHDAKEVPSVLLDFDMPLRGENPQDSFTGLLRVRRELSGHGLAFPLYDFGCIWYLHKTGKLTEDRLRSLFPAEEIDFVTEAADLITDSLTFVPFGKTVLNLINKYGKKRFTLYMQKRGLDEKQVEEIERMGPEKELIEQLPRLFAEDLNTSMSLEGSPERIVLFFDTHEAFWGAAVICLITLFINVMSG